MEKSMDIETSNLNNNNTQNNEIHLERSGQETMTIKLADNTGKKSETAQKQGQKKRIKFKRALGRKNYRGTRNNGNNTKKFAANRRQRGEGIRHRGVKIIVRNLTRNATNQDIKAVFEKIGPLKRCGINWNNLGESRGTAEVEYYYKRDAFKAARKLDYKSIRGVPIRLEMREGGRKISLRRNGNGLRSSSGIRRSKTFGASGGIRRFRSLRKDRDYGTSGPRNRRMSRRFRSGDNDRRGRRRFSSRIRRGVRRYNN